jgi:O-antigen ligase
VAHDTHAAAALASAAGVPAGAPAPAVGRAADAARLLFAIAAIGSVTSPPLANIAAALGLIAFCCVPQAWQRVCAAAAQPLGRGVLVFLATMAVAMLWADAPWGRRLAAWWSWRPLILMLVASTLFGAARWKDRFAYTVVGALVAAAIASFILRLMPNPILIDDPGILLRNHTTQGMAFVAGTALAVLLAWGRPASRRQRSFLLVALLLFFANIALIATGRSAHVALLVAGAIAGAAVLQGRQRWWVLVLIPLAGTLTLASSPMVRERFTQAYGELGTVQTSPSETSMGLRLIIWPTTLDLIAERPLLGYGVGGFAPAYARLIHQRYNDWRAAEAKDTHNQYLHVMVEAGIPGALAFLFFVAGVLRQRVPPPYRGVGLALFAAWLTTSLLNSHFQTFAEAHLIGLVLGVLLSVPDADAGKAPGGAQPAPGAAASSAAT